MSDAKTSDESVPGALRRQLREVRVAGEKLIRKCAEQDGEIEQLRGLAGRYRREGERIAAAAIEETRVAEAEIERLREVVEKAAGYVECEKCGGDGWVDIYPESAYLDDCPVCGGLGMVPGEDDDE